MIWKFPHYDIKTGIDWISIEKNYDWFRDMANIPQDTIWHAEGNVQIHTKMVCEAMVALPEFQELDEQYKHIMFTSALFHDVEKRSTTCEVEQDGRICVKAPKHAQRGEYTARLVLYKDIPTPFEIRELVCKLVRYHGEPLWKDEGSLQKTVVESSMFLSNYLLAMLSKADVLGRHCPDQKELLDKIDFFLMAAEEYDCMHNAKGFITDMSRYHYLTKDTYIDYVPFDETKFKVIMLSGIPSSGKDTHIMNGNYMMDVISLDDIRREMKIKPTDSKGNGRVIQEAQERVKVKMRKHESFIFNATNITKDLRGKWITLFEEYGGKVEIHYIEVPYNTLLKQNSKREYGVPTNIVEKLIAKLEIPTVKEAETICYFT